MICSVFRELTKHRCVMELFAEHISPHIRYITYLEHIAAHCIHGVHDVHDVCYVVYIL